MIIWLNGAFGAGKTTVADALQSALPGAVLFDPELVGGVLRRLVRVPTGDYQDLRRWRQMVTGTAAALDRLRTGPVVVPMTLLRERSTSEILETLRAGGRDVRHVLLDVASEELRRRIAVASPLGAAEQGVREWRQSHVAEYERERPRLLADADLVVDTTLLGADEIAAALQARLAG